MGTNGNAHIILPGQRTPQQGMSAAQREEERQALIAHVDILTGQVNEVTRACGALIQAQRQNETLIADLTSGLAGTNLQLSQALDRLTALDSHEDRIEALVDTVNGLNELDRLGVLSADRMQKQLDAECQRSWLFMNRSFMARVRWFCLGR